MATLPDDPAVDEPTYQSLIVDMLAYMAELRGDVDAIPSGVSGGGFETWSGGVPVGFTPTPFGTGASYSQETSVISQGQSSLKIVSSSTGGYIEMLSNDYIPVSEVDECVFVSGSVRQSVADTVQIEVIFYDEASSPGVVSTIDAMLETTLPVVDTWYPIRGHADIPAGARYYRIRITGGDGTADSNIYYDSIQTSISPFNWVWSGESRTIDDNTPTAILSVGYPKYLLVEYDNTGFAVVPAGWDGSIFTSLRAWDISTGVGLGSTEVSLDPTGQWNPGSSGGSVDVIEKAYK